MKTRKKTPLTAGDITKIILQRQKKARAELYKAVLKTIRNFKKQKKQIPPHYNLSTDDVNNVLATLIKNSTE